ncbi:MAG TPA: hypothetical protein PL044_03210 [Clostridiales bacterium]|nr:hypothetical protein [Clostridiales bacterium]HQK72771.1 hypothetical protein [Clostridiales bacterium]
MKTELYKYRVLPLLNPTRVPVKLRVETLEPQLAFQSNKKYKIEVYSLVRPTAGDFQITGNVFYPAAENGALAFEFQFEDEAEYYVRVFNENESRHFLQLSVYALEKDLFELRPLKGDFHVHTCRSDGKEHPAIAVANYREAGFDFTALTDHLRYEPSVEAQNAYEGVKLGMAIINGEEVHSPDNYVHVVNFGGESSVNALFEYDDDEYREQVREIIDSEDIPYQDKFIYAANRWVSQRIRERGGLSIFCHPHWINNTYNVPDSLSRAFLENGVFDAFELVGGQTSHENNMQTAFYNQLRSEGCFIPVTGASDSHGTINSNLFDKMFTVVFSAANERGAIVEAVKKGMSTAVEVFKGGEYAVHGSYRLVSYTRFLLEYYFPHMRILCAQEGRLMREYFNGVPYASEWLDKLAGATGEYYALCKGGKPAGR